MSNGNPWAHKKYKKAGSLGPAGRNKLWLYETLLDHPNMEVVYRAARGIVERFAYSQLDRNLWRRARRRLDKFKRDPVTDTVVCVDPLFRLRCGCRRGRPSKWEMRQVQEMKVAGDILELLEQVEKGVLEEPKEGVGDSESGMGQDEGYAGA